jgi:uncharacterized protein
MQSEIRKDWIKRVKPLIRKPESIKVLTGLEPWFQLPGQPTHTAPKHYKQAILVWIGVLGTYLMLSPHVSALLDSWLYILSVLVHMGITVAPLSYWVMPSLTCYFGCWLFK